MRNPLVTFRLNGKLVRIRVSENRTLLEVLREDLNLTGTKHGCELGECGACTVLIDGKPMLACLTLAVLMTGCEITTIEGLMQHEDPHPLQSEFAKLGASQCGYCSPGMLISSYSLLLSNPEPSPREVKQALSGNLCRCTGYVKILDAVLKASELLKNSRRKAQGGTEQTSKEPFKK